MLYEVITAIAFCPGSDYAANVELAEAVAPGTPRPAAGQDLQRVHTPGVKSIPDLCAFLKLPPERTVKAVCVEGVITSYSIHYTKLYDSSLTS